LASLADSLILRASNAAELSTETHRRLPEIRSELTRAKERVSWDARAVRLYAFGALKVNKLAVFPQPKAHNWTNCGLGAAKLVIFKSHSDFKGSSDVQPLGLNSTVDLSWCLHLKQKFLGFSYEQIGYAHCFRGIAPYLARCALLPRPGLRVRSAYLGLIR
jgi:hypothetical protein